MSMSRKQTSPDMVILCIAIFFAMFGLIMIFSSSAIMASERFGDSLLFLKKQLIWVIIGIGVLFMCMQVQYNLWQRYAKLLIIVSLVFLSSVLIIGRSVGGAQRWLTFGPFNFQPSEFAKLVMVIGLADFLDRKRSKMQNFVNGYLPAMIFIGLFCGLIFLEQDLGAPVVLFLVGSTMLFLSATKIRYIFATILGLLPVIYGFVFLVPYRKKRILSFLNPWADSQGSGYQIIQSLIAIGSGGFSGKGLGGSEAKLMYIPEPHTDFIYSIIGEELGLFGALMILGLYAIFFLRGIIIVKRSPDLFSSFLASGILLLIIYQALLNVAVVAGCIPTKGLPLPLLSFGGSSLIFTMAGIGILLNISQHQKR
ncbi:MAG: putative lipid II flippase FtsW [bacterium]